MGIARRDRLILDDNKGMRTIAETIESVINREYVIYEKSL
jgi:hypothetical protein